MKNLVRGCHNFRSYRHGCSKVKSYEVLKTMSDSNLTDALNGHLKLRQAEKYPLVRTQAKARIEQLARAAGRKL